MSGSPPGDPSLIRIPLERPLAGPPPGCARRGAGDGIDAVTGGGMAAIVDPTRGLRSVWAGPVQVAAGLRLRVGEHPPRPADGMRMDEAGWERVLPLPGGGTLVERGVLLDSAPAVLVTWAAEGAELPELGIDLQPPAGRPPLRLTLRPGTGEGMGAGEAVRDDEGEGSREARPVLGVAILPPGADPDQLAPRMRPPHARERARRARVGDRDRLRIEVGTDVARADAARSTEPLRDVVAAAVRALDRSPLAGPGAGPGDSPDPGRGGGPDLFLLGVEDGAPVFARGTALAEIALGTLMAGRANAAWHAFARLLADPAAPPLPILHLAAALATWTGEAHRLGEVQDDLDVRAARLVKQGEQERAAGAAFPAPVRVLEALADAVEPLGGEWRERLVALADTLRGPATGGSVAGGGAEAAGSSRAVSLPVIGRGGGKSGSAPPTRTATLPDPAAFAPVDAPGMAGRRTLHAARLVRAWVEGALGARPDATYGRLRLAPDLIAHPRLERVEGLRIGDAPIRLDCRLRAGSGTLRVLQQGGRVPMNLVFEPRLPLRPPLSVRIGDEPAEVSVDAVEGGVAIGCQFPLDPERRIVVDEER